MFVQGYKSHSFVLGLLISKMIFFFVKHPSLDRCTNRPPSFLKLLKILHCRSDSLSDIKVILLELYCHNSTLSNHLPVESETLDRKLFEWKRK